jgi:hypothetical protein
MAEEVDPLNLRERVRVPQVWLSGSLAAARRLARREVLESCDGDAGYIHDGDPDLLKPLAIPAIDPTLMDQAIEALERRDVEGFLSSASGNEFGIDLLAANVPLLKELGIYERGLLSALIGSRTNNYLHQNVIPWLIEKSDRTKLRAAGDPLPGAGPFKLYRGVAGRGRARHVRGLSWTASFDCAAWFARRYSLPNPTVLRVHIDEDHVLAYLTGRGEQEFVVALPPSKRPAIDKRDSTELDTAAERWAAKMREDREERLKKAKTRLIQNEHQA